VKCFMRGLGASLLCMFLLGVLGCGPDNETEAQRLTKSIGDPGAPDPKGVPAVKDAAPPTDQAEFYKRQMQQQSDTFKKGGYPGAKK